MEAQDVRIEVLSSDSQCARVLRTRTVDPSAKFQSTQTIPSSRARTVNSTPTSPSPSLTPNVIESPSSIAAT